MCEVSGTSLNPCVSKPELKKTFFCPCCFETLQVSTVDRLNERLPSMLPEGMSKKGFHAVQCENTLKTGTETPLLCI